MVRRIMVRWVRLRLRTRVVAVAAVVSVVAGSAWLALPSGGVAEDLLPSLSAPTDLVLLGLAGGQTPAAVPVQHNPEPPLEATPRAVCGPGSHPLDGNAGPTPCRRRT